LDSKKLEFKDENDLRPIMLFFQDEGRFGRINTLSKCWIPKGMRAIVGKQIIREYTYAYTSVCPQTGETFSMVIPYVSIELMQLYLNEFSESFKNYRVILTMDNAAWHTSKKIEIPDNIVTWSIPPYSPELNPAEHIWKYIRNVKKFNNHTFKTIEEVELKLAEALMEIENEKKIISSLTNYKWFNMIAV
jgi:transposase